MPEEKYSVGDVLYVISKSNTLVPVQVIEEVRSRTLGGEKLAYMVQIGAKGEKPPASLDKLPRPIFRSVESVKQYMLKNASAAIEAMVKKSTVNAAKWYGTAGNPGDPESHVDLNVGADTITPEQGPDLDDDAPRIELPGGMVGRLANGLVIGHEENRNRS